MSELISLNEYLPVKEETINEYSLDQLAISDILDVYEFRIYSYLLKIDTDAPSYSKIAEDINMSRSKVIKTISELEKKGFLQKNKGTGKSSNSYKITKESSSISQTPQSNAECGASQEPLDNPGFLRIVESPPNLDDPPFPLEVFEKHYRQQELTLLREVKPPVWPTNKALVKIFNESSDLDKVLAEKLDAEGYSESDILEAYDDLIQRGVKYPFRVLNKHKDNFERIKRKKVKVLQQSKVKVVDKEACIRCVAEYTGRQNGITPPWPEYMHPNDIEFIRDNHGRSGLKRLSLFELNRFFETGSW